MGSFMDSYSFADFSFSPLALPPSPVRTVHHDQAYSEDGHSTTESSQQAESTASEAETDDEADIDQDAEPSLQLDTRPDTQPDTKPDIRSELQRESRPDTRLRHLLDTQPDTQQDLRRDRQQLDQPVVRLRTLQDTQQRTLPDVHIDAQPATQREPQSEPIDHALYAQTVSDISSYNPYRAFLRVERAETLNPSPGVQSHATSVPWFSSHEEEELQRAIELSRTTAEEEEERRRKTEELRQRSQAEYGRLVYAKAAQDAPHLSSRSPLQRSSKSVHSENASQHQERQVPNNVHAGNPQQATHASNVTRSQSTASVTRHPIRSSPLVTPLDESDTRARTFLSTSSVSPMSQRNISHLPTQPVGTPAASVLDSGLPRVLSNAYRPSRSPVSASPPPMEPSQKAPPMLVVPDSSRSRASSQSSGNLEIRDASRTRTGSSTAASGEACEACQVVGPRRSYCNVCSFVFCDGCWDAQLVHKSKRLAVGAIPHEKTEHNVARKVQDVLTPALTDEARERLHTADIDTTWFGVVREEHELPLFRDYGRYANIIATTKDLRIDSASTLSATTDRSETLYPSLVSFVGQTGAGKSTLIKLLIDLKSEASEGFPTPVVGAAGRDVSTSEDVHLYLDPDSSESQAPLLFADCEGLEGGERDPVGAKLKKKLEKQAKQDAASGGRRRQRLKHTSERELTWADSPRKQSREFAVAHLYPRLLYTFSDVIVFVLKNPRVIESVLERLVDWAAVALEKSSNQPVLPHAIIALNASENNIQEELWDIQVATIALMESLSRTVYHNATFKKYAQYWRERDRQIESVEQLMLSYYSSLQVIRIPTTGRPNLIQDQVGKLSVTIRRACFESRERKKDLRMLLDADDFQPYLQTAFDHFATDLNTPFDFVQASFTNSPIPNDFGGNILKVALLVMECWKDLRMGTAIFEELSYLVASCIMLDAARHKIRGNDDQIFPMYLEHLDNALDNFCGRHWPCEFVGPKGGRCVNVRSGHGAKGHQLKSGTLLAAGDYEASFNFDSYRQHFREDTYHKLKALRQIVQSKIEDDGISEEQAAAEVHRESVLPAFFDHASDGQPQLLISHTVCCCCLFEPPEHALPCAHIICTSCLKAYGKANFKGHVVEISECPMEKRERHFRNTWRVFLKPANCGVRILTLDGGGVRGAVELEILKQIVKELGGAVNIQSFFDLIVGTSTGGIIALGLTARNWTLDECTRQFESLCGQAFTRRIGGNLPVWGWIVSNYNHSIYETQPLQEALTTAFTDDQYLFGGRRGDSERMDVKVAVTATSAAGHSVVFANYNRLCLEKLSYHFQRPEKLHGELRTWEAARATSAAPTYFKPFHHEPSKQVYSDGGIYHNNPIEIADRERRLIWPAQQDQEPDVIVSIGTLFCEKRKDRKAPRWVGSSKGIVAHGRFLQKMAQDHLHTSLDSEKTWRKYMDIRKPNGSDKGRYVRLNPEVPEHPPKLDDVGKVRFLQETTRYLIGEDVKIKALAQRLVATCFYLDTLGEVKEDVYHEIFEVAGYFHCRFLAGPEVAELGKYIKRNANAGHDAHFLIREEGNVNDLPQEIRLDSRIINRMVHHEVFRMDNPVQIRRTNKFSRTGIWLCLTRDTLYPISGFPRCLHSDKPTLAGITSRHALSSTNSVRWAGRTNSQQQRWHDWRPPIPLPALDAGEVIARYSDASRLLGNATRNDLVATQPTHVEATVSPERNEAIERHELSDVFLVELPTIEIQSDRYYIARDDWVAEAHLGAGRCLRLRKGDMVKITYKAQDGWWRGHTCYDPKEGWMPEQWMEPAGPDALSQFHTMELDATNELPRPPPSELDTIQQRPSETSLASESSRFSE